MTTDTAPTSSPSGRLTQILPLLACPRCSGALHMAAQTLQCGACPAVYPVRAGVPVLLPESMQEPGVGTVSADDPVSRHPYSPAALEIIEAHRDGWVLDLGAGGKHQRWDNVIQIDIFRFPMTDVVCTADRLPFRDNAFKAVISQAVFEHLQFPEWAAAEIRRVLQPGGIAKIDTAFLQPEHGYPHHFYNATETGLRHWFRDFDIRWSGVEAYQHPQWSLSWFLGVYLDRVAPAHQALLRQTTVGDLLSALERRGCGQTSEADTAVLAALDALPLHAQRILAAGVSIDAINPPKLPTGVSPASQQAGTDAMTGLEAVRQLSLAREELSLLRTQLAWMQEQHTVVQDRSRYLAQFYPKTTREVLRRIWPHISWRARLQFSAVAWLRACLSHDQWRRLRSWAGAWRSVASDQPARRGQASQERPFATIILEPRDATALADTFFSLVRQDYSAWELVLLQSDQQNVAVRQAMSDFARLDARVCIQSISATAQVFSQPLGAGVFRLWVPEGATLAFHALRSFMTLVRQHPQVNALTADLELTQHEGAAPLRCYHEGLDWTHISTISAPWYVLLKNAGSATDADPSALACGHIPEVLFHRPAPLISSTASVATAPQC